MIRTSGSHTLHNACERQAEPRTLGYELSIADNDPLKIIIFERHASKPSDDLHTSAFVAVSAIPSESGGDCLCMLRALHDALLARE